MIDGLIAKYYKLLKRRKVNDIGDNPSWRSCGFALKEVNNPYQLYFE
jgi:hypothetical protein